MRRSRRRHRELALGGAVPGGTLGGRRGEVPPRGVEPRLPRFQRGVTTAYTRTAGSTPTRTRTRNFCLEDSRDRPFHHRGQAVAVGVEPTGPCGPPAFETG